MFLKKILLILLCFLVPALVKAVVFDNPLTATSIWDIIDSVLNFVFMVGLAFAPISGIAAAYYFFTSAGNPERINKAKQLLLWSVIGLLIVLAARALPDLIADLLGN